MTTLTIRNLEDDLNRSLCQSAAENGHSVEEEARVILRRCLKPRQESGLGNRIRKRFAALGGVDLDLPERRDAPGAAEFG